MNDGLDDLHSDREDGIVPSVREIVMLFLVWMFLVGALSLVVCVAGCLSS